MSEVSDLQDDLQAVILKYQPMATNWVLALETTELDEDGDIGGSWTCITSSPSSLSHMTLAHLTHQRLEHAHKVSWGLDDDDE